MVAMDITFESEPEVITGSTPVPGLKMSDAPKAPAPKAPASAAPAASVPNAGDAGTAAKTVSVGSPEDAQKMIDRLMGNPKFRADYANANNPDRAKLVAGMTQLFAQANPEPGIEEEGAAENPADVLPELRRDAGVPHPDLGGYQYDPADEANFLNYVIDERIPTETARAMTEWYGTRIVTAGWAPLSKEDESDFRNQFAGRLSAEQIDTLVKWHREEITPRLLKGRHG
jgi:hypothetical protein